MEFQFSTIVYIRWSIRSLMKLSPGRFFKNLMVLYHRKTSILVELYLFLMVYFVKNSTNFQSFFYNFFQVKMLVLCCSIPRLIVSANLVLWFHDPRSLVKASLTHFLKTKQRYVCCRCILHYKTKIIFQVYFIIVNFLSLLLFFDIDINYGFNFLASIKVRQWRL